MEHSPQSTNAGIKQITLGAIVGWVIGIGFLVNGAVAVSDNPSMVGINFLLGAFFLPPTHAFIKNRWHVSLSRGAKIAIGFLLLIVYSISASASDVVKRNGEVVQQAPAAVQDSSVIDVSTQQDVPYQTIKTWNIPNGGYGKAIVIAPTDVNEARMTALGETLRRHAVNDRNAFIFVFSDKKAAEMRDAILTDTLSDADRDFYDTHFVGSYMKNGNSGYHTFTIYLAGVMGTQEKKITY